MKKLFVPILFGLLSSCGGGGGSGGNGSSGGSSPSPDWVSGVFEAASEFKDFCENPRSGADYDDLSGSTLDENNWLRSWTNDTYLWYDEVLDRNPSLYASTESYFDLLKTNATTASGADKDQFHFTYSTDEWEQLSQSGVSAGYGFAYAFLSTLPYEIAIVYVEPDSPAAAAGLGRGDRILEIDGVDAAMPTTQNEVDILNAGLLPGVSEPHSFLIQDQGTANERTVELTSASVTSTPVFNVSVIPTATGNVGYILFNDHIATAEQQLIDAIDELSDSSVTDLILDLRYNGGGYLAIASELSYMIAGATATNGQIFELSTFNDKHPVFNPVTGEEITPYPFIDTALGFSATPGEALPSLDLPRVFILATGNTASASEAIINGLRGIGVEVLLFGDTTRGKPYGFYATDNCGTTYFSIQMQAENAAGFGDYADGFAPADLSSAGSVSVPGCAADDDLDQELGDTDEGLLAKALQYRETGTCNYPVTFDPDAGLGLSQKLELPSPKVIVKKSPWLENRDMSLPNE